ncbi:MAG: DUF3108 domain-containing protein [Bacteroidales bacterium]|nr:DUF3108 domain-containing protein [Bacteroidales bacterium]
MRKSLLPIAALLLSTAAVAKPSDKMAEETLSYKVMYKWGLINKQAGSATLTLKYAPDGYISQLTASSAPWADKIYMVRDTLNGHMLYDGMRPTFYEKIANEGNERKHDKVSYKRAGGVTSADCVRKVVKKGVQKVDETRTLETQGEAVDMLSSFYFMRRLPYQNWQTGHTEKIDIFSGKRKELLTIEYHGIVKLDIDGVEKEAYYITFIFTSGGGKKTSDDMEAWISTGKDRVPLRLEGKLPVGKVHCILTDAR